MGKLKAFLEAILNGKIDPTNPADVERLIADLHGLYLTP